MPWVGRAAGRAGPRAVLILVRALLLSEPTGSAWFVSLLSMLSRVAGSLQVDCKDKEASFTLERVKRTEDVGASLPGDSSAHPPRSLDLPSPPTMTLYGARAPAPFLCLVRPDLREKDNIVGHNRSPHFPSWTEVGGEG